MVPLPTPTPDSDPIPKDEANEPKTTRPEDEEGFGTLDEIPISFWLSGPNEELGRKDQQYDESIDQ